MLDLDYAKVAKAQNVDGDRVSGAKPDDFPIENARLRSVFYPAGLNLVAIIGYGWALQARVVSDQSVPST